MARFAIGDVQGCFASLERLLHLIQWVPGRDELWLTGDLVNRGPRSLDVMRWAIAHDSQITVVLGNHDLHFLGRVAGTSSPKKRDTLDDLLAAKDRDRLVDWLRRRPLAHVAAEHVMVHAGIHPAWSVAKTAALSAEIEHELAGPKWRAFLGELDGATPRWDDNLTGGDRWRAMLAYLIRARTLHEDGRIERSFDGHPKDAPKGCVPWFDFPGAQWTSHVAVFGHWAALGLDLGPHHVGLDTGCVWGNSLTAIRLDDRQVFQVKSAEAGT